MHLAAEAVAKGRGGVGSTAHTRKTVSGEPYQPLMHVCQWQPGCCQQRALCKCRVQRRGKRWGRDRGGNARHTRGVRRWSWKEGEERRSGWRRRKERAERKGRFMHLAGDYTPALHMSSILSFKSSLREDRTKHRDNHSQRRKHKIIKEPQSRKRWTCASRSFLLCWVTDRRLPGRDNVCNINDPKFFTNWGFNRMIGLTEVFMSCTYYVHTNIEIYGWLPSIILRRHTYFSAEWDGWLGCRNKICPPSEIFLAFLVVSDHSETALMV